MIKKIEYQNKLFAIIISNSFKEPGIHFVTPDDYSQQLAYMNHPKGKKIQAHYHNIVKREVTLTQEVLFIKKGKLRVDFYDQALNKFQEEVLSEGDCILLSEGGHGFEVLEDIEMIEVKQGPYSGEQDKTRF